MEDKILRKTIATMQVRMCLSHYCVDNPGSGLGSDTYELWALGKLFNHCT